MKKLYICEKYSTCTSRDVCWACMPHLDVSNCVGMCDITGDSSINLGLAFEPTTGLEESLATSILRGEDYYEDICEYEEVVENFKEMVLEEHYEKLKSVMRSIDVGPIKEWRDAVISRLDIIEEVLGI